MPPAHDDVLIVGLGDVAQTHLKALEHTPGAEVIAGVDIAARPELTFHGHTVPVYRELRDACSRHAPDIVVITTPTPTHADVCAEVSDCLPAARILVEKPAADTLAGARQVLAGIGSHQPVDVAYHMAFAPEVTWGMRTVQQFADRLGDPAGIEAFFSDPYQDDFESASTRLADSWIDSGINALSVLSRFAEPADRSSLTRIGEIPQSVFEAHVSCRTGSSKLDALILTSWHVLDGSEKTTRIRYSSGAELVMDHTAVAGYLRREGRVAATFGSDGTVPRRERHYLALYQLWLTEGARLLPAKTSLRLHELLLQAHPGT